jgi:hypothetical protein
MNSDSIPNIPGILDEQTARRIKLSPHRGSNRASEAGHPCERFLVLARTKNELRTLHDVGLQRIFDEGNLHEGALLRDLAEAGIKITEQQRAYEWPKFELTGRIDGKLTVDGTYVPIELKSCSPNIFPALRDVKPEDMVKSKYPWVRKYPAQILLYMLMEGVDIGLIIFKNKQTGEKLQKVFSLDGPALEYVEGILKKLEVVNGHVKAGTEPPVALIDDCKNCPFAKTACFPGQDYGPGIDILQDPELEVKLARRGELQDMAKEFEALDKEIKEGFRGRTAVVGEWMIESSKHERRGVDLPADIKKQYEKITEYWITKIEKI